MADIAQLVERQVVVLDVTGSSPVVRPIRRGASSAPRSPAANLAGKQLVDVLEHEFARVLEREGWIPHRSEHRVRD